MQKKALFLALFVAALNPAYAEEQRPVSSPETPVVIDCSYSIPANQDIEPGTLTTWAEKAGLQAFSLSYDTLDQQLSSLQPCFTEQGWKAFHDALQKSGNLNTIKTQEMMSIPKITGAVQITPIKENQWKATFPITMVYQSKTQQLTQPLSVSLLIGRKVSGSLGIMQVITSPPQPST